MTRSQVLEKANDCVNGNREQDYGTPEDNFRMIADLWSAYMETQITPIDVAMMMCLLKIARVSTAEIPTDDCFVDIAGYAACAGEIKERSMSYGTVLYADNEPVSI